MNIINKQKFLNELSKLLTFMYEEDRDTAIAMYDKMFDMVPDEDALISALASPTRQAVQIARAYNSKDTKLSVHAKQGLDAAQIAMDEPAPFIEAIKNIFSETLETMHSRYQEIQNVPDTEVKEIPDESQSQIEESIDEDEYDYGEEVVSVIKNKSVGKLDETEIVNEFVEVSKPKEEKQDEQTETDIVEEFLNSFAIIDSEIPIYESLPQKDDAELADDELQKPEIETDTDSEEAVISQYDFDDKDNKNEVFDEDEDEDEDEDDDEYDEYVKKSRENKKEKKSEKNSKENVSDGKLSGGALALFLLIAIPLTSIGLILILVLALAFLVIAAAALLMGFRVLEAAFGSFTLYSDVLVVTGTGLVLSALGVLFFWTFIYLLIGLTVKMVNGVINLAISICTKKEE